MKTEIITCDCCTKTIAGGTWEDAPGKVVFHFGHPEQSFVTTTFEHVCYSCRQFMIKGVARLIADRKGMLPEIKK